MRHKGCFVASIIISFCLLVHINLPLAFAATETTIYPSRAQADTRACVFALVMLASASQRTRTGHCGIRYASSPRLYPRPLRHQT